MRMQHGTPDGGVINLLCRVDFGQTLPPSPSPPDSYQQINHDRGTEGVINPMELFSNYTTCPALASSKVEAEEGGGGGGGGPALSAARYTYTYNNRSNSV